MKKKIAFLDRDGTINVEKHYLYKIEDFEYLPGVVNGLKLLQEADFLLVIVTNQSGIARGYYTKPDYEVFNKWLLADLEAKDVHIAGSYYCPHHPEAVVQEYRCECDCRKPATGLFYRAVENLGKENEIDLDGSITIGDKPRDLSICADTKVKGFLIGDEEPEYKDAVRVGSLLEAARIATVSMGGQ